MSFTNIAWAPLVPDATAERRAQAMEKSATAQQQTANIAQETADSMAGAESRAMFAQFLAAAMQARLAADLAGSVAIARQALQAVDETVPLNGQAQA